MPGAAADLPWAQALDETYGILCRHSCSRWGGRPGGQASLPAIPGDDSPLIAWRGRLSKSFSRLLAEGGWLTPGSCRPTSWPALNAGKIALPQPAPGGGPGEPGPGGGRLPGGRGPAHPGGAPPGAGRPPGGAAGRGPARPGPGGGLGGRPAAGGGRPGRAPAPAGGDRPGPGALWPRSCSGLWPNCWGRRRRAAGWAYNFSQGPRLAETPLFLAATLPLRFVTTGERREDLVSPAAVAVLWRPEPPPGPDGPVGPHLAGAPDGPGLASFPPSPGQMMPVRPRTREILARLDRLWAALQNPGTAPEWRRRLERCWRELEFRRPG